MMFSLSTSSQLKFSKTFPGKSAYPSTQGGLWGESCIMNWKKRSETNDHAFLSNCLTPNKGRTNDAKRDGIMNVAQVCVKDDYTEQEVSDRVSNIDCIKNILNSMDDGQITVSPYDTAWVSLIKDLDGHDRPQFPSSLDWIAQNQLPDGSWGEEQLFLAYDRLLNTLACVFALRSWKVHNEKSEKGISFIKDNICKLENANVEEMTCGFELVFPVLLQKARDLGIEGIPYDAPVIQNIFEIRDHKMKRVPMELIHKVPTCLLHNLEGLEGHDWEKLIKLQSPKGTFITSPASTAFAVMATKDEDCIAYLKYVVKKFNGGAPTVYPVDIYARLWAVDRLERLGVSRFFKPEIKDCLDYIRRFWQKNGSFSARESEFVDIDDSSMGFRLLRLHGYDSSPSVLDHFKNGDQFNCYAGQAFESPSPIFNLFRASQVLYPGEKVLEEANNFAYNFLKERLDTNNLLDKWLISKHLPDEIRHGLEMPWYATLPRVEARFYIENYGSDDIWIGKSLYRMPEINNEAYIQLAKSDYRKCQAQHQMEWNHIQQWYESNDLHEFGISQKSLLLAYYLATANIFEVERSKERLAWFYSQIILDMITSYFNQETTSTEQKEALIREFINNIEGQGSQSCKVTQRPFSILLETLQQLTRDSQEWIGKDISHQLLEAWATWLKNLNGAVKGEGTELLIVNTLNVCGGHVAYKEILSSNEYQTLSKLTSKICHQLSEYQNQEVSRESKNKKNGRIIYKEIDGNMQLLLQLVIQDFPDINKDIKQTFLMVAKTYYYRAYYATEIIDTHVFKVLFDQIV